MKYQLVIWDWNGTIIDDINTALLSVNDILLKRGMPTINLQQYYSYMDAPIIKFYENLFDLSKVDFNIIAKEFSNGYDKHLPQNPIKEDTLNTLKFLQNKSIKQVIVSASHTDKIKGLVKKYNIDTYFNLISGASDHLAQSKIARGKAVINSFSIPPSNCVVIGDCIHDNQMAKEIGADCILYSGGHQSKSDLLTQNVPVIDNISDVLEFI